MKHPHQTKFDTDSHCISYSLLAMWPDLHICQHTDAEVRHRSLLGETGLDIQLKILPLKEMSELITQSSSVTSL